jgi:hypothetical protein
MCAMIDLPGSLARRRGAERGHMIWRGPLRARHLALGF